jgi:hypothetical protein
MPLESFTSGSNSTRLFSSGRSSPRLVPEGQRRLPEPEGDESGALLHVVVVDAGTGIVRVLRAVSLSPAFTRTLDEAIRAQAAAPWLGRDEYDQVVEGVYARCPNSEDLLVGAIARTRGGE